MPLSLRSSSPLLFAAFSTALLACGSPPLATTPDAPSAAASTSVAPASSPPARPVVEAPPSASVVAAPSTAASASPPASPPSDKAAPTPPTPPTTVLALTQGKIPDAARDLAIADGKVRACLAQAKTPAKKGELVVKITISTTGFTLNADVKASGDVSKEAASCAKAALRDQTWGRPEGGGVAAAAGTFLVP